MPMAPVDASFPAAPALICWQDRRGNPQQARWRSEAGVPPHAEIELVGDNLPPEQALQRVQQGVALLWHGDWVRARHFMQALGRLADRMPRRKLLAAIYCVRGGSVSKSVHAALTGKGFDVRYVEGGLAAWDAAQK